MFVPSDGILDFLCLALAILSSSSPAAHTGHALLWPECITPNAQTACFCPFWESALISSAVWWLPCPPRQNEVFPSLFCSWSFVSNITHTTWYGFFAFLSQGYKALYLFLFYPHWLGHCLAISEIFVEWITETLQVYLYDLKIVFWCLTDNCNKCFRGWMDLGGTDRKRHPL